MALRQQVVLVQVPLCAAGRRAFRVAPIARQPELVVGVDDGADCRIQLFRGDLALVDEASSPHGAFGGMRGVRGSDLPDLSKRRPGWLLWFCR